MSRRVSSWFFGGVAASLAAVSFAPGAEPPPALAAASALALAAAAPADHPLTYADARAKAIAGGKPLVVWVGADALCPPCVRELAECVHHVTDSFPDTPRPALVVAVPEGGELLRVATVTQWTTGHPVFGHVPSIRRAIRAWRGRRHVTASGWSLDPPAPRPAAHFFAPPASFRRGGG